MTNFEEIKKLLNSKELYFEASLASDFGSLRRRLDQQEAVIKLNEFLLKEDKLDKIINYVDSIIKKAEKGKRINDITICCCILVLAQIPPVDISLKNLINSLKESPIPALKWASNFTKYCIRTSQNIFTDLSGKPIKSISKNIKIFSKANTSLPDEIIKGLKLRSSGGLTYA